jgi:hypothetical protein
MRGDYEEHSTGFHFRRRVVSCDLGYRLQRLDLVERVWAVESIQCDIPKRAKTDIREPTLACKQVQRKQTRHLLYI